MLFAVLFSLAIASLAAAPQDGSADDEPAACKEDWRSDACRIATFDRTLDDLQVTAIEDEAATGAEIYRVRTLTAWGRPLPVISFERRLGHSPLVVATDVGGGRMSTRVGQRIWSRVVSASAFADRDLVPEPPAPKQGDIEEIIVCADGSTVMAEMANAPARLGDHRAVRRKLGHSCEDQPVIAYAALLAQMAAEVLPACAALNRSREGVYTLRNCLALRGDTLAAADLMNALDDAPFEERMERPWTQWLGVSSEPARLDWAGQVVEQSSFTPPGSAKPTIAAFMAERVSALTNLNFYENLVGAETASRGWVTGQITYQTSREDDAQTLVADYRQVWTKKNGYWGLESWSVEPFTPAEP